MSVIWPLLLFSIVLFSVIAVQVNCSCVAGAPPLQSQEPQSLIPTFQLRRCTRNPEQTFQLIPAALYSNGVQNFISPFSFTQPQPHLIDNKRATRQHQSAVVQQVTINQNAAIDTGHNSFGFSGFKHPFSLPHHHSHHGFGGRPSFGIFRERSFDKSNESITAPKCPSNYVFSCHPTVAEAPCESK